MDGITYEGAIPQIGEVPRGIGRPRKDHEKDVMLQAVQGIYKAYCLYVHNQVFMNNDKSTKDDLKWKPSKFHKHLCDTVQEFIERPNKGAYEILILSTPPQHGKSTTITETLPSWFLMKNPDKAVIEVSYGDDLAERFGKRNLEKIKEFGNLFGVEIDPRKATSREFNIAGHTGRMISRGIGSALTGYNGDLIIIDDPIKNREQADSERTRDSIWNEFMSSILTRAQADTKIILIMTRWHEDDLAGRILKEMPDKVTYVNYECECESDDDPLGRRKKTEDEDGEALCPEIGKDNKWLKDFKKGYLSAEGRRSWEALFQGHPSIQEGNILKKTWWQRFDIKDYLEGRLRFDYMIMSVDAAFKDGEKNDYVAIEIWGKVENRFYLIHLVNEHLDFSDTVRRIRVLKAKYYRVGAIYIEDKANGSAIINTLRHEIAGIIPVRPDVSKEARVNAVSFVIEAGNVFIPDTEWGDKFIEQCAKFPNDKHDDMVDAMSQALKMLVYSRKGMVKRAIRQATGWHLPDRTPKKLDVGGTINVI